MTESTLTDVELRKNPGGGYLYRATVTSRGTMGKLKGEKETLTGVVFKGQNPKKQIRHHASVRGFGRARFKGKLKRLGA